MNHPVCVETWCYHSVDDESPYVYEAYLYYTLRSRLATKVSSFSPRAVLQFTPKLGTGLTTILLTTGLNTRWLVLPSSHSRPAHVCCRALVWHTRGGHHKDGRPRIPSVSECPANRKVCEIIATRKWLTCTYSGA